jgi:putative ABC transport system permease protein
VAVPLGMWGARLLCRYLAVFLNFDITSFAVPLWVYLLAAAAGIVVPLLSAAYPVWKGSGVSVREALADYGVPATSFGNKPSERFITRIGGRARPILLAVRNSFRRRTRLVLTVLTLAAGGMVFMSALNLRASLIHTLDRLFAAKKYDLSVGLGTMHEWESVQRAVLKTPGVVAAEGWITSEAVISKHETRNTKHETRSHAAESVPGDRFNVIALPSQSKLMQMDIIRGRGFRAGEKNALIVNNNLATRRREMKVGNTVSFQMGPAMTTWTVVGVVREPFSPSLAYIPLEFFDGLHPGQINSVRLVLDKTDPQSIRRVEAALDENLEKEGIRARSSASKAETRYGFDQHMVMIYVFLIITALIIAGVGGLGLMTTMSLNVLERRREMGVLRAIGASPRAIWLIVVAEAVVIGVLSCLLAFLVAWPASKAIGNFMVTLMFQSPLDFSFEKAGIGIWLVISIALAVVASFLPAWHASRGSIREALTYE